MTAKTDYNFGLAVIGLLTYGAVGLFLVPSALASIGLDGIFVFLAVFCAVGLFMVPNIPRGSYKSEEGVSRSKDKLRIQKISALAGVFAFNLAVGAAWAYLFLVGIDSGIEEQVVANILTLSQFLGILGGLFVVFLSSKINRGTPLGISILFCAVGIGVLLLDMDFLIYSAAVFVFNFFWNIAQPYLIALLAAFDDNSKTVIRGSCMQMLGYAIGPYIAASILGSGMSYSFYEINLFASLMFFLSLILMLPAIKILR